MPSKQKQYLRQQAVLRADAFCKAQEQDAEQKKALKAAKGMSGDVNRSSNCD
jgi:hypothetical protein